MCGWASIQRRKGLSHDLDNPGSSVDIDVVGCPSDALLERSCILRVLAFGWFGVDLGDSFNPYTSRESLV